MNINPEVNLTSSRIIIKYLVEIINSFFEPLSWKALAFMTVVLMAAIFIYERTKVVQNNFSPSSYSQEIATKKI
jgi:hypothetical protein